MWIDASTVRLSEPFFYQSLQRVIAQRKCETAVTGLGAVLELSEQLPNCEPDGFIFHASRCGFDARLGNTLKSIALSTVCSRSSALFRNLGTLYTRSLAFPARDVADKS